MAARRRWPFLRQDLPGDDPAQSLLRPPRPRCFTAIQLAVGAILAVLTVPGCGSESSEDDTSASVGVGAGAEDDAPTPTAATLEPTSPGPATATPEPPLPDGETATPVPSSPVPATPTPEPSPVGSATATPVPPSPDDDTGTPLPSSPGPATATPEPFNTEAPSPLPSPTPAAPSPAGTPQPDVDADGFSPAEGDCDDADARRYPGAVDPTCDGIDQDCDGSDALHTLYRDQDGDGFGDSNQSLATCEGDGWVHEAGDCDDANPAFYPGAPEPEGAGSDLDCDGDASVYYDPAVGLEEAVVIPVLGPMILSLPSGAVVAGSAAIQPTSSTRSDSEAADGDAGNGIVVTVSRSSLNDDPEAFEALEPDRWALGSLIAFSPALVFPEQTPATVTYSFYNAPFLQYAPNATCSDWVQVWQLDEESTTLSTQQSDVACDLEAGTITVAMPHFSVYLATSDDSLMVFKPRYEVQDNPGNEGISADSGAAFSRYWDFTFAGYPVTGRADEFSYLLTPEQLSEVPGLTMDRFDVTYDDRASVEAYSLSVQLSQQGPAAAEVDLLVYVDGEDYAPLDPTRPATCPEDIEVAVGADEYVSNQRSGSLWDFNGNGYPDFYDCLQVTIQPDPLNVDDDRDGYTENEGDCDDDPDTGGDIHPDELEVCDGLDNDCDGLADDDDPEGVSGTTTYYHDGDHDAYGAPASAVDACEQPAGYVAAAGDCNDASSSIHPGAGEVCDGVDQDCDLEIDEGAQQTFYVDDDIDGYGDPARTGTSCELYDGLAATGDDCDDHDPDVNPETDEVCDGLDQDCDQEVDEGVLLSWYPDADGDGHGQRDAVPLEACATPPAADGVAYVDTADDCDDNNAAVNPSASDVCDSLDNDCDGSVDEDATATTWYRDADGDGYGSSSDTKSACSQPSEYVSTGGDCNDSSAAQHPGAAESCNGIDDDCDDTADDGVTNTYYVDADSDGYGSSASTQACSMPTGYAGNSSDCNDANGSIHPGASDLCDSIDNDCDGSVDEEATAATWYRDADSDGYGSTSSTSACAQPSGYVASADDCDDSSASVHPGAAETCNGADDDCDDSVDEGVTTTFYADADGDGYGSSSFTTQACSKPSGCSATSGDCDDTNAATHPGASDACDSVDNDCDGSVDEEATAVTWHRDADGDGYGSSSVTTSACSQPSGYLSDNTDCDDASTAVHPGAAETCNGVDDDCDDATDDADPGGVSGGSVYYRDVDGDGYGNPASTTEACTAPDGYVAQATDCDDTRPSVYPGAREVCDCLDSDCNGIVDDPDQDGDGFVGCGDDCNDENAEVYPGADEVCDGVDNGCNGVEESGCPVGGMLRGTYDLSDLDVHSWKGGFAYEDFGYTLATSADVTGDGAADLLIGAPFLIEDTIGFIWVLPGPVDVSGDSSTTIVGDCYPYPEPDCILPDGWYPNGQSGTTGESISIADVNGDGIEDVLFGSLGVDGGVSNGEIRYGPIDSPAQPDTIFELSESDDFTALYAVDSDEDDGPDTLLFGSVGGTMGGVYVKDLDDLSLEDSPYDLASFAKIDEGVSDGCMGGEVSSSSDLTQDGFSDLILGSSCANTGDGSVYLLKNASAASMETMTSVSEGAYTIFHGTEVRGGFGSSILTGVDLNQDGRPDLVIGAPDTDDGGAVYVFFGEQCQGWPDEVAASDADLTLVGPAAGAAFGSAISGGGDFNGDGWPDIAIGAPNATDDGTHGEVFLLYGPLSLRGRHDIGDAADLVLHSTDYTFADLGYALDLTRDLTGDRFGDLVVSGRERYSTRTGRVDLLPGRGY